ncbi:MAG: hypothetical protein EOP50_02005 [Sphingobacteriales bacterium]|nr:MAG: hypothetical protein EOP50_02005 [Sphingobacteriales bacterium]
MKLNILPVRGTIRLPLKSAKMTLYSYCIPNDDGAAPNPFWGLCTLAICKPVIRRVAQKGDWIIGTGSMKQGFENKVVYAMEVTDTKSLAQYDTFCNRELVEKIPDIRHSDPRRRLGDCIYDFSTGLPQQRPGVHDAGNVGRDLGGKNVLLSNNFIYFGSCPQELPPDLLPIVRQGQGHRSKSNGSYLIKFLHWVNSLKVARNQVLCDPYGMAHRANPACRSTCAALDREEDDADERFDYSNC